MDTNTRYESVERYDYTAPAASNEFDTRERRAASTSIARPATVECGSGWYHDAAIKDAKDALAHPYR